MLITSTSQHREDPQFHSSPAPWTPLAIEVSITEKQIGLNCRIQLIYGQISSASFDTLALYFSITKRPKARKLFVTSADTILSSTMVSTSIYTTGHLSMLSSETCWNGDVRHCGHISSFPSCQAMTPPSRASHGLYLVCSLGSQ